MKIGLWIDATVGDNFFSPDIVQLLGCQYHKIPCNGIPSHRQVSEFNERVKQFMIQYPDDIIVVSTKYGFNCAGFLVVSNMILDTKWHPVLAFQEFSAKKEPGIFKPSFIEVSFQMLIKVTVSRTMYIVYSYYNTICCVFFRSFFSDTAISGISLPPLPYQVGICMA